MGSLQIFTIIMSIKSKLIYISIVLWIHKKICTRSPFSRMQQNLQYPTCISSGKPSLRTTDLKEDKQTYKSKTFGDSEVVTKFTLSFQSDKFRPLVKLLCHTCPALPPSSQCPRNLDYLQPLCTNSSRPEGRSGKQECFSNLIFPTKCSLEQATGELHAPDRNLRNSTSIFHSIIQECKCSSLTLNYNRGWKTQFIDQHQLG